MESRFKHLIFAAILSLFMTSCEWYVDFNYIVTNKSSKNVYLILYPDEKNVIDDYYCQGYGGGYLSNNEIWYSVTYLGDEEKKIDCPLQSVCLKSGESVKFTTGGLAGNVGKNPETRNTDAIWLRQNCLKQIVIGEDSEYSNSELSNNYWARSSNWIIQNKKSDSIEYWLVIDDEVIREHSIVAE